MKHNVLEPNKTMHHEFCRLGDGRKAFLRSTPKAVTPFGGLAVLIEFWRHLQLPELLGRLMPFSYTSPNSHGWKSERRFVVVRERVREDKRAVGRKLIDVPGYTYRVFVTNRPDAPEELWRDYNQRACVEQRICELKDDLAADGFCRQEFYATEAAFRAVLVLFNLLSMWQTASRGPERKYQRASSLRTQVFVCGALAGRVGHTYVLHMSMSWGGLETRKGFMENAQRWCESIAPRLENATDPPAQNAQPSPQN